MSGLFYLNNKFVGHRSFYKWINSIFNKVDHQRIKEVGPDRAASEWLLRCGAAVKWKNQNWITDYSALDKDYKPQYVIEEIDASESCVMNVGFYYLNGLKYLKRIKFYKCIYLENACLHKLSETEITNSLECLEIVSCGNISDEGLHAIAKLKKLKNLYLNDLPEVHNKEKCLYILQNSLPKCVIKFPIINNK